MREKILRSQTRESSRRANDQVRTGDQFKSRQADPFGDPADCFAETRQSNPMIEQSKSPIENPKWQNSAERSGAGGQDN
jgi:hypothetical protein